MVRNVSSCESGDIVVQAQQMAKPGCFYVQHSQVPAVSESIIHEAENALDY